MIKIDNGITAVTAEHDRIKCEYSEYLYDHFFKGNLIGASCTGKTKFMKCLTEQLSEDSVYHSTIGVDFHNTFINIPNKKNEGTLSIKLQLWDGASQERYMALTESFLRGTSFIFLFYKDDEFDELIQMIKKYHFSHEFIPTITFILIKDKLGELTELPPLDSTITTKLGITPNFHFSLDFNKKVDITTLLHKVVPTFKLTEIVTKSIYDD